VASRALADAVASQEAGLSGPAASLADGTLRLEFDSSLHLRAWRVRDDAHEPTIPLTPWVATDSLLLADGGRLERFALRHKERAPVDGPHGRGTRLALFGSAGEIEKRVRVELYERYPGFAFYRVSYRNASARPIALRGWRSADLKLLPATRPVQAQGEPQFWSYCGSTHADRRDWVQPVKAGFSQENFMGMTASDYGGGTPIVDVWRRDCGLAVGHLEATPRLISLPVTHTPRGVSLAIAESLERTLASGEELQTPESFIATHSGDYFVTLDAYRRIMAERGLASPRAPDAAYEGIWCAWG
jgi:alpha-galactosidase